MSSEITPIILMTGLMIVAVMIAINSHGRLRIIVSYTLATVLFCLTAIVFFNHMGLLSGSGSRQHGRLSSDQVEKGIDDRRSTRHADSAKLSPEKAQVAAELRRLSAEGTACANSLLNKELKDESVELATLVGRASETRKRVDFIKNECDRVSPTDPGFRKPFSAIKEGVQLLSEAAQMYLQYYYAEDSNQEVTRENLLRQKARGANEQFHKAANLLASIDK